MNHDLSLEEVTNACRPGGPSVLTSVTHLRPAAGPHAAVAPARFVDGRNAAYSFETRYIDGEPQACVLLDQKASQLNRVEDALRLAIEDENPVVGRVPRVRVTYPDAQLSCLELPHRAFDGHVRASTVQGLPTTENPAYIAARNSSPANAMALLNLSPASVVFGSWDSTRKSHQVRLRSALVGEVVGVLADQDRGIESVGRRGGARVDSYAPSVRLGQKAMQSLLDQQRNELSSKTIELIEGEIKKAGARGSVSASRLGLGAIPPALSTLGLVACRDILRSHVLSFSTLRQLRFGSGPEGDAACRALLAALAINGLVRSNAELYLRANCDLVESEAPHSLLDGRNGAEKAISLPDIDDADELLEQAMANAQREAGVDWQGQIFEVAGNIEVAASREADADDDGSRE